MRKNKNLLFVAASLILFLIIGYLYASPVLSGKQLFQHDIVQYKGGAKELLDYRDVNKKETYWSDSMFGGMPTYQMGSQFRGDLIKQVDNALNLLPKPINYFFLLFAGFFLLGIVAVKDWRYALLGATFFGMSTYFYIIIAAGHNGKVHTIAYFAPLLAGILLVYIRKKYVVGFIVTTLFMGLQIAANHPQMTYYLFLGLGFLFISEFVRAVLKKTSLQHFLISSGLIALAMVLGIGMNSQRIMANAEYVKETVRGKQILDADADGKSGNGLDKESILMWSYGKVETLNLFIPRLMGGGSNEPETEEMMNHVQEMVQENVQSQQEMDRVSRGFGNLTYWGDQPGTSGPAYQGAVVIFLALLGFFFGWKKYRYWILGATILTLLLAWGSNFAVVSNFFIDFVPFYNKFRAPSSILVVIELLLPLIAVIGLYRFINDEKLDEKYKRNVLLAISGVVLSSTLLLLVFGKDILGFSTENEKNNLPSYILDYLIDERYKIFSRDAWKAFLYVLAVAAVLFFVLKKKINSNIALLIIGVISIFDLWSVNKNYLNKDNFVDEIFAEQPFQTETSPLLEEQVEGNAELERILSTANVNKVLATIAEKDKKHYRIFNQLINPFAETNTSYFKSSVGGYHAVKLRRYDDLIGQYFKDGDSLQRMKTYSILDLLNTKYIIGGSLEAPEVEPNPNANGNAWFVSQLKFAKTPREELNLIGVVNHKKIAVIGEADEKYFADKKLAEDSTATIQLTNYKADELQFKTTSSTPQLAVFSEIYYPYGWTLFLDEKEVPYVKADYLLRSVFVPAGNHNLIMRFEPEVINTGKTISLIAFFLFIILSAGGLYLLYRTEKKQIIIIEA